MSRLRPLPVLIFLAAIACGDGVAARVADAEISDAALHDELKELTANDAYVAHLRSTGGADAFAADGGWTDDFVAGVLTRRIHFTVVKDVAERERVQPTASQLRGAERVAAAEVGGPAVFDVFSGAYRRELTQRQAYLAALRRRAVDGLDPVRYYDDHRQDFAKPCTRHVVVATEREAAAARQRIVEGESFAGVASDVSLDETTNGRGGDLGCNAPGDLIGELNHAVAAQEVGEISAPVSTDVGWELIVVERVEMRPYGRIEGEVRQAIERLADARMGASLRRRFATADVSVSGSYGTWDEKERKVVVG